MWWRGCGRANEKGNEKKNGKENGKEESGLWDRIAPSKSKTAGARLPRQTEAPVNGIQDYRSQRACGGTRQNRPVPLFRRHRTGGETGDLGKRNVKKNGGAAAAAFLRAELERRRELGQRRAVSKAVPCFRQLTPSGTPLRRRASIVKADALAPLCVTR